jgi:hypothetical protein
MTARGTLLFLHPPGRRQPGVLTPAMVCGLVLLALLLLAPAGRAAAAGTLQLDTIFASDTFTARLPTALQWLPGGGSYAQLEAGDEGQSIVRYGVDGTPMSRMPLAALVELASGQTAAVTTDGDGDIFNGIFDYGGTEFGWVDGWRWSPTGEHLYVQHLTRDHKTLRLWRAGAGGEGVELLHTDTDPAWIDITDDLTPLADDSVLWTSEASGWRHLYRIGADGRARQLAQGQWTVGDVIGVDEAGGWAYFYGKRESLIDQYVYRVPLDGGPVEHEGHTRLAPLAAFRGWPLRAREAL